MNTIAPGNCNILNSFRRQLLYLGVIVFFSVACHLGVAMRAWAAPASSASLATTEGQEGVPFDITPNVDASYAGAGGTIYMVVQPDAQTDVGDGPGASVTLEAVSSGAEPGSIWRIFRHLASETGRTGAQLYSYTLTAKAVDDDEIEGTHTSTIRVGYRCDTNMAPYPAHTTQATITNTITDNDTNGNIHGSPLVPITGTSPCLVAKNYAPASTPPPDKPVPAPAPAPLRPMPPATAAKDDQKSAPFPLNSSDKYTSGEGEILWLKVGEGATFNLDKNGHSESHSITVKNLSDRQATLTVASDPFDTILTQDETQYIDADKDGQRDISITLVNIADEQAGLLFKPVSVAAKAPTPAAPSRPALNTTSSWHPYALAGILALLAAGAWLQWRFKFVQRYIVRPPKAHHTPRQ